MKILTICEICNNKWMLELKQRETIQCPNCKRIFNMIKVMNDPENKEIVNYINSQTSRNK